MKASSGYIRKIETMGMLDGPGIRTVVFFAGCPLRCSYCHNPDMWTTKRSDLCSAKDIVEKLVRLKPYYGSDGGVTFCGGEPLNQPEFLIDLLKACKEKGIHTVLDTSGYGEIKYFDLILSLVDLVLFDLKALDKESYHKLTSVDIEKSEIFLNKTQEHQVPLWIRTVIVPGLNDNKKFMDKMIAKIQTISNVEKVELLPYHTLGVAKYKELGIDYPLKNVLASCSLSIAKWQEYVNKHINAN